jgi:hypothetical protein
MYTCLPTGKMCKNYVRGEEQEDKFIFDIHMNDFEYTVESMEVPVCGYIIHMVTFTDGCILRFCVDLSDGKTFGWCWLERSHHIGGKIS